MPFAWRNPTNVADGKSLGDKQDQLARDNALLVVTHGHRAQKLVAVFFMRIAARAC